MNENYQELSQVTLVYDRCPLCEKIGRSLACSECEKNQIKSFLVHHVGNIHSNATKLASLMVLSKDLQEKLSGFQDKRKESANFKSKSCERIKNFSSIAKSKLEADISNHQHRIKDLQLILLHQKREIAKKKKKFREIQVKNEIAQKRLQKTIPEKKARLKEIIRTKKNRNDVVKQKINVANKLLQNSRKNHVRLLREFIFPMKEIGDDNICASSKGAIVTRGSEDRKASLMEEALDEARRLLFVNGRWVDQQVGSSDISQISVATCAACAPADGNYSSYLLWLEENHNLFASDLPVSGASMSTSIEVGLHPPLRSSVFRISAALSHAAQMLMIIRKILVVHLPHRISYKTFCNPTVPPNVFINSVKLLNSNILSLCLQEGVDGSTLHPLHTLRNLQILTERLLSDEERRDFYVPDISILVSMEETLGLADAFDDDTDSDVDELDFESDWQAVESSDFKTTDLKSLPAYTSTNAQSSVISQSHNLVSSAFSWARGWWSPTNE